MSRLFKYGDQAWEDPGAEFSNEDVKRQLTAYFPELSNADVKESALPDGRTEVLFVKRSGTKGSDDPVTPAKSRPLSPGWIAARLANVKPAALEAPALLGRLQDLDARGELDTATLLAAQPDLERVTAALSEHVEKSKEISRRCSRLPACPGRSTPAGF